MKIAFFNIFGDKHNAEQETLMRLRHVLSKQGADLIEIDRDGYLIDNKNRHIEDEDADVLFTYNVFDFSIDVVPDIYSVFFHWVPIGFSCNTHSAAIMQTFNCYDGFGCFYEKNIFSHCLSAPVEPLAEIGSSVPLDYVEAPRLQTERKLFYVGVNFERALSHETMRYEGLLKALDETGKLEIYGPKEVYGKANLWAGFRSYQGEIPFDGHSIIQKINRAGICLALNSPMHNDADAVSNRTFEAAAAGAVIISDDNAFVRRYFGDSVFYIARGLSDEEASGEIMQILQWINEHPNESYWMAKRAQEIFVQKLSLDTMVKNFLGSVTTAIQKIRNVGLQNDIIDVVCYFDSADEYAFILSQIQAQYYQNLHLILITEKETYDGLGAIHYEHTFIENTREAKGKDFVRAKQALRGKYFMFIDPYSLLHARHIYKNHEVISNRDEMFVYSGSYVKRKQMGGRKYIVLNNQPITRDEFLLFSRMTNWDFNWGYHDRQVFFIETIFSRSAGMFRREILEYADDREMAVISDNVHHYLACCSLIKGGQMGRFTYALTTGYAGDSVEEMERKVFGHRRRHWYSNMRSAKTYIKEMNEIFFKYTFECYLGNVPIRDFCGVKTRWREMGSEQPIPRTRRAIRAIKRFIPKRIKEFIKKIIYTCIYT